jgi:hypothetical protein
MTDRAWRHGGALLLAGLFLTGQTGLSGLDGVLFHSAGRPTYTTPVHVESPRAPGHATHCLLGYTPSAAGVAQPVVRELRLGPAPAVRSAPVPVTPPRRGNAAGRPRPRAPPLDLA